VKETSVDTRLPTTTKGKEPFQSQPTLGPQDLKKAADANESAEDILTT
jgi:hypothetical protein